MNERIRELAEQAGFFPELNWDHTGWHAAGHNDTFEKFAELIVAECMRMCDALRQALETEQEPVAWRYALDASVEGPRWIYIDKDPHQWLQGPAMVNAAIEELHTSPPQRKPLTDEEIIDKTRWFCVDMRWPSTALDIARAIEAAHGIKEKNNE